MQEQHNGLKEKIVQMNQDNVGLQQKTDQLNLDLADAARRDSEKVKAIKDTKCEYDCLHQQQAISSHDLAFLTKRHKTQIEALEKQLKLEKSINTELILEKTHLEKT